MEQSAVTPFKALAIAAAITWIAAPLSAAAQEAALYRVKCGGEGFTDKQGHVWEADAHFEGGQTFRADSAIGNTDIPYLYQSERWNDAALGNLKYTFPVRAGEYKVILHFAEIWDQAFASGQRVFDVSVNGTIVAPDLDVFAQAGALTPLDLDFLALAQDGKIIVEFANKVGNAKVAGIEVLPMNPPRAAAAPYRIRCGGDDWIDPQGNWWEGDSHFSSGAIFNTTAPVSGTELSQLYQQERWNATGDLAYAFDVAPGAYTVRLHFAEIYYQTAGMRVFDVDINGANVIQSLDLAADPGPNVAVVKEFNVEAADGKISIAFRNQVENAKIAAIEIVAAGIVAARPVARLLPGRKAMSGAVVDVQGRRQAKRAAGYRILTP